MFKKYLPLALVFTAALYLYPGLNSILEQKHYPALRYLKSNLEAKESGKSTSIKSDTSWKYLGRPRPGMTPLRFPPDSLLANNDWFWHGSPIFSPDLKEMYWGKYTIYPNYQTIELAFTEFADSHWTPMQVPTFANLNYDENNPLFSLTGDTLFFFSMRPGGFIYRVARTSTGWTQPMAVPVPVPSGMYTGLNFSFSGSRTLYFELSYSTLPHDIFKSALLNGSYQMPVMLDTAINSGYSEICPYMDPDERFIIFASNRPGSYGYHDLYISTRNPDNTWNAAANLGPVINSSSGEASPYITPDGLYFFYTTEKPGDLGYNPYWISAQYIYNLIPIGINSQSKKVRDFNLFQNYPNPFNPGTRIKFQLANQSYVKLVVFDLLGRELQTVLNEDLSSGTYVIDFDGSNIPSGAYFYSLTAGDYTETKKMVFIK
jgi:Secretion system C-terminal sorting domain/WD40-like Beta Propeller Repeat